MFESFFPYAASEHAGSIDQIVDIVHVLMLILFIGWGVFIMSVIADAFAANGITQSEWDAFVAAIPFQLYAWLAISMVPVLVALNFDYGPMARAESALTTTPDVPDQDNSKAKPILVWLPLLVLGVTLAGGK